METDESTWLVGSELSLVTTAGEEVAGTVFTYDKSCDILVLATPGSTPLLHNVFFLKATFIKKLHFVKPPAEPQNLDLPALNLTTLQHKAQQEYQAAKVRASKIGIGVSKEGQQLFDALAKTMDCRWSGTTIVCRIADSEVTVKEPYQEENVAPIGKEHRSTLDRIRQIVKEERSRWS